MNRAEWLAKRMLGKPLKEAIQRPSQETTLKLLRERVASPRPVRVLGTSADGGVPFLSEEFRASHIHILGTTQEGKSKFLELLLRHDIDNGYGATLLDPSDNGKTVNDVFRYCVSKGIDKVCLIDPHDNHIAIPCINPLRWRGVEATDSVVSNLMEAVRLLWGQANFDATPRIEKYLTAIFSALYATGNSRYGKPLNCGIPDAACFLVKDQPVLASRRKQILAFLHPLDESRLVLEEVFEGTGQQIFLNHFQSSIGRLSPFFKYLPHLIYGSESSIDFRKLISERWIVLVNLDKSRVWGTAQQRLLGTLIVNEVINAVADLRANGWQGKHYLYIDEAGQFATRALADIMAYKGKSGLWATLSHQFYTQFEDKYVLDAVENLCKVKILFNTPNTVDRNRMLRDMYTGELKEQASDAYIALKKQHAVIKIGKEPPVSTRIADIPGVEVSSNQQAEFKAKLYKSNPWYRTADSIQEEINNRFAVSSTPARAAPKERRSPGSRIKPQRIVGEQSVKPIEGEDKPKPKRKSVFDNLPDS